MKTGIPTNGFMVKKPHLIKNGIRIPCNTENFVPVVVPALSSSASGSSSTLKTPLRQESHSSSSSSTSSSSPTVVNFRLENEKIELTVTSLQCKCQTQLVIDQGNLMKPKPIKIQNPIKRKPRSNGATRLILKSRNGCKN